MDSKINTKINTIINTIEEDLKIKKEKRRVYNYTYYDKHRLELLKQWRENYVSQKESSPSL